MFESILQRLGLTKLSRSGEPPEGHANQQVRPAKPGSSQPLSELAKPSVRHRPQAALPKKPSAKSLKSEPVDALKTLGKIKKPVETSTKAPLTPQTLTKTTKKSVEKMAINTNKAALAAQPIAAPDTAVKTKPVVTRKKVVTKPIISLAESTKSAESAVSTLPELKKPLSAPVVHKLTIKLAAKPVPVPVPVPVPTKITLTGKKNTPIAAVPVPQSMPHLTEKIQPMISPPALKPGRRSSARAPSHLPPPAPMVPTHAPDAAKASYSAIAERPVALPPHVAAKKDPKLANNWKTKPASELTDDEIRAMPDAEYMNNSQMAFFRYKLSILKRDIHNSAGKTTEHLREETVVVPDPADRATIEEEHALELRTRDRERKLLKKIEQSIGRIDSGDYGYCDETGEPIGVGRLIARPTANLSLEAQQRRELKQKMFGD